jgi:hypothetical protein
MNIIKIILRFLNAILFIFSVFFFFQIIPVICGTIGITIGIFTGDRVKAHVLWSKWSVYYSRMTFRKMVGSNNINKT